MDVSRNGEDAVSAEDLLTDGAVAEDGDAPKEKKRRRFRLSASGEDRASTILAWANLVVALLVIGLGILFVLTVYQDRESERLATPALRTIEALKDVVRSEPNSADARVRLGEALAGAGLHDDALDSFAVAIEIEPDHAGAYLDIGLVSMIMDDLSTAESAFLKVLEITGESQYASVSDRRENALYNLGVIALNQDRFEDAAGFFREALRIRRDASDTYYHLGLAYQGMDEEGAALEQFNIALLFDPNFAEARLERALIYVERSSEASAVADLRWAADLTNEAEPIMEVLLTFGPIEVRVADARTALDAGDLETAEIEAHIAWSIDPGDPEAIRTLADVFYAGDNSAEALDLYRELLELDPDDEALAALVEEIEQELGDQ